MVGQTVSDSKYIFLDKRLLREELSSLLGMTQKAQCSLQYATKNSSVCIPLTIFSDKAGILETLVFYMKNLGYTFKEISIILGKDNRVLWCSYREAKKKIRTSSKDDGQYIPITAFVRPNLTCFEAIVISLKDEYGLSINRIADIFHRNYQTIWTTYRRAKSK